MVQLDAVIADAHVLAREKDGGGSCIDAVDAEGVGRIFSVRATREWPQLAKVSHKFQVVFGERYPVLFLDDCRL